VLIAIDQRSSPPDRDGRSSGCAPLGGEGVACLGGWFLIFNQLAIAHSHFGSIQKGHFEVGLWGSTTMG
jgi:hypothetical protein